TAKAQKRIKSRYGKAVAAEPSGRAIAAASVTMPRMPHHETTKPPPSVGMVVGRPRASPDSLARCRRSFQLAILLCDITQTMRTTMTVTHTAAADQRYTC